MEPGGGPRVAVCDTDELWATAAVLFDAYRHHYGQPPADGRTLPWLSGMVRTGMLTVFLASVDGSADPTPAGVATAHAVPASLARGLFWQLRDLYVPAEHRRRGVAAALVRGVRDAAEVAGASRLSLTTEPDNEAALGLYRQLGFETVEGLTTLSLEIV